MKQLMLAFLGGFALANAAVADMVMFRIPRTDLLVMLKGDLNYNPGGTVTFRHELGRLFFSKYDVVDRYEVASFESIFTRKLNAADDADAVMEVAGWALKHGLLGKFILATQKAHQIDPQHEGVQRVVDLYRKLQQKIGDASEQERHLRKTVRLSGMRIRQSAHFILLHDTPDKPPEQFSRNAKRRLKPRAEERLALLERVYRSFLYKLYSKGVPLDIPQEKLMVVLFNKHDDYLDFASQLAPELASTVGFYDPRSNISFFFDHGSSKHMKPLRDLARFMQQQLPQLRKLRAGQDIRFAETLSLLVAITQENEDIEVVSHEATHQLAANTGLLPRHVLVPQWVHEGLATYFEAPDEATWSGMGAVNKERLGWYRALLGDREHSSLDFVVGDQIFKYAESHGAILHGYGQAWALTHFLMEEHFDELMTYYRRIGEMPPDTPMSPAILNKIFDASFSTDRKILENEWRRYMRSLKTDLEVILTQ